MKKFYYYIITNIVFLSQIYGQSSLVLNQNVYVVLSNSVGVVLNNPNTNAILTIGTGGNIISENEFNIVKWDIGTSTGNYVVPFTTSLASGLVKIPLNLNITTAGIGSGSILFSTYETATDANTVFPTDVTNMNSYCNTNNALYAIDRFWIIDAGTYSAKPKPIISFGYNPAANETGGSNTIVISKFKAQRFNSISNSWETPQKLYGLDNVGLNAVVGVSVTPIDFFKSWTLIDTTIMTIPINIVSVNNGTLCTGNTSTITVSGATTYTLLPGTLTPGPSFTVNPLATTVYTISGTLGAGTATCNSAPISMATATIMINLNIKTSNQSGNWSDASIWTPSGIPSFCDNVTIANTHTVVIDINANCNKLKVGQGSVAVLQFGTSPYVLTTSDSVTINSNATLNLGSNNDTLYTRGNFINNGIFVTQNGTVKLNGTSTQTISGTASAPFYNLDISPAAGGGVTVNKALTVSNLLTLDGTNAFTITTNNNITLLSVIGQSAYIDKIISPNNVTITGDITMQRYVPSAYTGWSNMGSPGIVGKDFTQWNNTFAITCLFCPNGYNVGGSNFGSIQKYNELVGGSYDNALRYIEIVNTTDPMTNGQGFWVYRGASSPGTISSALTITVTGQVQKGSNSFIITTTGANNADHGWNLLANPYPAPISWFNLRNGNVNLNDEIDVYNPNLNGGSGAFAQYAGGVSNPLVISGGIDDNIPMGQGFYVHTSPVAPASFSLNYNETMKTTSQNPLLKTQVSSVQTVFRLAIDGSNNWHDETVFHFNSNATNLFDTDYDAIKLNNSNPSSANISSLINGIQYGINGLPALTGFATTTIPVLALVGTTSNYTISPIDIANLPVNACVMLHDNFTNADQDLRLGSYTCTLFDTTITSRFNLNITLPDSTLLCGFSTGIHNPIKNVITNYCPIKIQMESNSVFLNFNFTSEDQISVNIYDISGKKIVESVLARVNNDRVKLNLTNLSSGMYLIRVESLTCTVSEKIIW